MGWTSARAAPRAGWGISSPPRPYFGVEVFGVGSAVRWLCLEEGAALLLAQRPHRSRAGQAVLAVQGWEAAEPFGASPVVQEPCAEPCPSRDSTGGARWAAGPLSQPRDTDLIHSSPAAPWAPGIAAGTGRGRAQGQPRARRAQRALSPLCSGKSHGSCVWSRVRRAVAMSHPAACPH